ncbi:MAG: hypothetical protein ACXWE0_01655 [Nitrososphaeraceae archaeon]
MIFTGILANQKYWALSTSTKEIGIETKKKWWNKHNHSREWEIDE